MSKRFDGINPADTKESVMRGDGVDLPLGIHCNNATCTVSDWLVIVIERPLDRGSHRLR